MKKRDDYISGPHHYWIHFWCGLVFGGFISASIGFWLFDGAAAILTIGVGAIIIAYCCGRWGDSAWRWLIENLF